MSKSPPRIRGHQLKEVVGQVQSMGPFFGPLGILVDNRFFSDDRGLEKMVGQTSAARAFARIGPLII